MEAYEVDLNLKLMDWSDDEIANPVNSLLGVLEPSVNRQREFKSSS